MKDDRPITRAEAQLIAMSKADFDAWVARVAEARQKREDEYIIRKFRQTRQTVHSGIDTMRELVGDSETCDYLQWLLDDLKKEMSLKN